jgi:hypothetical protein
VSSELDGKSSTLSSFVDEFIKENIKKGNVIELFKLSCMSSDFECHNKGKENIAWKDDFINYILLNKKDELLKIAAISYVKYFSFLFFFIFLTVLVLRWLFFKKLKSIYVTLIFLPFSILIFDILLFYFRIHPVFFELGFLVFQYALCLLFFYISYILFDLFIAKKLLSFKN